MKKILLLLIFLLIGCNNQEVTLNFKQLEMGLSNLSYRNNNNQIDLLFNTRIVSAEELKDNYNFNYQNIKDMLFSMPNDIDQVSMYAIILPKKGQEQIIKSEMKKFFNQYLKEWSLYFPNETNMITNRSETTYGNYLIYIISNDNNKVLNYIKNNKQTNDINKR